MHRVRPMEIIAWFIRAMNSECVEDPMVITGLLGLPYAIGIPGHEYR